MTEKSEDLFCNPCALQFDKKIVFDLHTSLLHETAKSESGETISFTKPSAPFQCERCNKIFTRVKISHIESHFLKPSCIDMV